jgi:hypothetical protein
MILKYTVMRIIFQKENPRVEQEDSSTWAAALTQPADLQTGQF